LASVVFAVVSWRWCTAICIHNTGHLFTGS